jgi:hypothetical protein
MPRIHKHTPLAVLISLLFSIWICQSDFATEPVHPTAASASTPAKWGQRFGGANDERLAAMRTLADGGVIVIGNTHTFKEGKDAKADKKDEANIWVVRLDAAGAPLWQRVYGGPKRDWASAVEPTADGGFLVTGETESFGAGKWDAWLLKLDKSGEIEWQKTYGGARNDTASAIISTPDNRFLIVGYSESFFPLKRESKFSTDHYLNLAAWVFKIDSKGEVLWQRTYLNDSKGTLADLIVSAGNDQYVIAGDDKWNGWLFKISGATGEPVVESFGGGQVWSYAYSSDSQENSIGRGAGYSAGRFPYITSFSSLVPNDNGFFVTGKRDYDGSDDSLAIERKSVYWMAQISKTGKVIWTRTLGRGDLYNSSRFSATITPDHMFLLAGELNDSGLFHVSGGKSFLLKIRPDGVFKWQRQLPSSLDEFNFYHRPELLTAALPDGSYIVARTKFTKETKQDFEVFKLPADTGTDRFGDSSNAVMELVDNRLTDIPVSLSSLPTQAEVKASTCFTKETNATFVQAPDEQSAKGALLENTGPQR